MEKFRKPAQFYIDEFDKGTIKILKALEMEMFNAKAESTANDASLVVRQNYLSRELKFREKAVELNRVKNEVIAKRIEADEEKDRKVKRYPIPMGIQ